MSTPPQKSHQCFTREMMTALPHLHMHTIFSALDVVAFSPKARLCSPTDLLKFYLITSHKTGVSWVAFVISTHAQSWAFGLTKCTLLLLFTKTILKFSPIHQPSSDSLSLVSPVNLIISVSTPSQVHNGTGSLCEGLFF